MSAGATLEWLLAQPELGLRLVTGEPGEVPIAWAHAIDALDPTEWLAPGALVLTTGFRLPEWPTAQRDYVGRLADTGIAGLGFGIGLRFDRIPETVVQACRDRGLPLVEVPRPTAFISITQAVAQRIAEGQVEGLQRALTYQRDVTRAAVRGGLGGAVSHLAKELGCEAVVLDEYGVVMAGSTRAEALLDQVRQEYRRLSADPRPGTVGVPVDEGTLEMQMIQGRSGICGWLAVRHREPFTHTERLLLNQAAGLITLQLDWPAELIDAYHALGGTLLSLLLGLGGSAAGLERHLHHFGFEPRDEVVLVVAETTRRRARLEQVLAAHLESTKRAHVACAVDGGVAVLLLERDARSLVEGLEPVVVEAGLQGVVFGISGTLSQDDVAPGLASARLAASAARQGRRRAGWFTELTLGPVLADEAVRSRVWALAEPAIEALLRESGPRERDLVESLETFLHHNGSWESAARALGVHRHTLRSRMARVEELTGLRLDVAEHRVLLHLALMSRPR